MPKTDLIARGDLAAGLGLLTRLPVRVDAATATARGAAAAWTWPLVGAVTAALATTTGMAALWLGLPTPLAAALVLATQIILTGAMHEDGLADSLDGLWGGWDKARRLAIMKDSHIGTYGVLGLGLGLLIRWQAVSLLLDAGALGAGLIGTAMLSRAAMVGVMAALPPAREGGLGHSVGRPAGGTTALACGLAVLCALLLPGLPAVALTLVTAITATLWATIARARIGGQTGDILGATQQLAEIALLVTLSVALS
ncbi:MAG: adenosylcobinamide-GDP ribazoletransferase [Rhodobacterales bacterium]|nr:adenosylcobinamide-GDP ribazoletransferase [Rhodobacterales bacterium]